MQRNTCRCIHSVQCVHGTFICTIVADCSEAPEGRLDAEVTYGHERFPATVKETNPKTYQVTFHPRGKGTYKVWLVYSGLVVKGTHYFKCHLHVVIVSLYFKTLRNKILLLQGRHL